MKKKIIIAICIVVVIVVGLVIYTLTNLDSIVKSLIESAGTKAVGTQVTVSGVNISLSKGQATIKDLKVANPEGFSDNSMIDLGEITAQIDYKTYAIKNIHVGNPHFLLEQKGTNTNFGIVQENLNRKSSEQASKPSSKQEPSPKAEKKEEKTYQIDSFTIKNAVMDVVSLDTGDKASASVGKIRFTDLKGTPEQICQQIFAQLTAQVIQQATNTQVQNIIKQNVKGDLGNTINSQINNLLGQ